MSFLKKIQKKGRGKNHRELYFRAAAPSPTLECAKDESIFNKKETTKEESRKLSRPESLKNFQDDNRSRDITSSAACSKEATPKVITAPRAPLSEAVGDDEKKEEEKAHADTKGNGPKADSCRSNKTRSGSITVNRKAPLPPTSDRPSVSHPSPCQSAPPRRIPVRPAPPRRPRPARPPPPTVTQRGKKSGTASNAVDKGPCSVKKKANEICKYPKELNPFANCNSTTDDDCSSQKSEEAFGTSHQRQRKRQKYSKREEYPMKKNSLDDADEMSEKVPGTRRQRRKGKQKESKSEEYLIEGSDCPSSDVDEMSEKPSSARRKRRTRKRKESKNEEFLIGQNPSNDTDWGKSSSCSDSTETSDMWSVSSLEDIQFAVNTAAIPELNVKNAEQGLAGNNEKDAQINREDSGDLKAHSFPSCREVSSVNVPSTKKGNDSASIRSTNVDASTAKEFKDADEKPILKQAKASEEASAMEERQGGDDCASNPSNRCPELAIYAHAELQVVESELLSLQKVMAKLESEMKEAMDSKDCEAEFQSLSLDWLALNKFRTELDKRKKDLFALCKQENPKMCLKFLREDLRCLLEVKSWKKTKEHRAQVKNVLDLILKLANMA